MRLLCSAVAVLALATICNASCSFQQLVLTDPMHPPQGCLDEEGKLHVFGSEWVKDCQECSCSQEGLSCCSMIMIPSDEELPLDWSVVRFCERACCRHLGKCCSSSGDGMRVGKLRIGLDVLTGP
ncbi:hypothetical protein COCON_G00227030 [Conger conger]|uniref:Beta-microseminoprotein n=1 Tax=Conger conger TaxID=82655 RepID=A0A9Q1CX66_CONCO|nr:hypothetical protein COCON_G00227030 [Conger conger]